MPRRSSRPTKKPITLAAEAAAAMGLAAESSDKENMATAADAVVPFESSTTTTRASNVEEIVVRQGKWTFEEMLLFFLYREHLGNDYMAISHQIPSR
jgi:hypothetical protein